MNRIIDFIKRPYKLINYILYHTAVLWPDKMYLKLVYYSKFGKKLNLSKPKTFCEKLQWLKLYDRKPEYITMADKVKAKVWAGQTIGEQYIIPTLGVWERAKDIDFEQLPQKFVLKCNHNSGKGMFICKDKSMIDKRKVTHDLEQGLKENYYLHSREWPYKDIPRRILAEEYINNDGEEELTDYKFFCFNGEPYMMYISKDHAKHATTDFFDMDFNLLPIRMKDPNSKNPPSKPKEFEEMRVLAKKCSKGIPFLRVDFYIVNHKIYLGELTFFHNAGFKTVQPEEWNLKLGQMINLPQKND